MMKVFILSLAMLSGTVICAQVGDQFPMLIGQKIDGKAVDLPEGTQGKFTLLGMAWSKKAEPAFESWINPVYNKFIAKTGMMDDVYDINVFFIPMFTGVKKGAMDDVMDKMKAKSSEEIFPYVLFYKGELEPYEASLKLENKEFPYIFLLDKTGKIVWKIKGRFSEDKMFEMEQIILK